jgi:hypothetical protein
VYEKFNSVGPTPLCLFVQSQTHLEGEPAPTRTMVKTSRSFQQHQGHIHSNSSKNFSYDLIEFSVKKSFNIQELLHHKSKRHGTKPTHPSFPKSFPKMPRTQSEASSSVDLTTTKQKQTTFPWALPPCQDLSTGCQEHTI